MVNTELHKCEAMTACLKVVKHLNREHLSIVVSLISRLVFNTDSERKFAHQFVNGEGLKMISKFKLLRQENAVILITDTLAIVSQLARISKEYYEGIHNMGIYTDLRNLIGHRESSIRAKVCNLLGNLCRHSHFFYKHLQSHGLIKAAIDRCEDPDTNTRKFACFAVGNAGFHTDWLYDALRPCVPKLVRLLTDDEEKTRANAAGALGNFVRNNSTLCPDLIAQQALQELLNVVKNDSGGSQSPRRIALFSIGNLCVYPECRRVFEGLNIRDTIKPYTAPTYKDTQIVKYATRIFVKLNIDNK